MIILQSEADLLQMIAALHSSSGFAGRLNRRQQQRDEHADDGNHHQQLDESKTALPHVRLLEKQIDKNGRQSPADKSRSARRELARGVLQPEFPRKTSGGAQ